MQRGPMPMTPSVIRSLAAALPVRPRRRAGTIHGKEIAAPAAADCFKTSRRDDSRPLFLAIMTRSSRESNGLDDRQYTADREQRATLSKPVVGLFAFRVGSIWFKKSERLHLNSFG